MLQRVTSVQPLWGITWDILGIAPQEGREVGGIYPLNSTCLCWELFLGIWQPQHSQAEEVWAGAQEAENPKHISTAMGSCQHFQEHRPGLKGIHRICFRTTSITKSQLSGFSSQLFLKNWWSIPATEKRRYRVSEPLSYFYFSLGPDIFIWLSGLSPETEDVLCISVR